MTKKINATKTRFGGFLFEANKIVYFLNKISNKLKQTKYYIWLTDMVVLCVIFPFECLAISEYAGCCM